MGAVTAKFYKSPPAPTSSSETKEKSATPDKSESLSQSMNKSQISDNRSAEKNVVNISDNKGDDDGWDVDDGDDGWGDMNQNNDEDKNEGWDDNDDWGSLEDNSNKNSSVSNNSSSSYDWGGGFNQATKTHDAFADVKPSSTSDNLMAGPGGWDDWGASSAGVSDDKEEARWKIFSIISKLFHI